MVILSNFQPRLRELSAVTNALQAVATTTTDHGYTVGQLVRFFIPKDFGMTVEYLTATIVAIPADDQITVDLDTSKLASFVTPSTPPSFTQAHVLPIDGLLKNDTSITG